MKVSHDVSSSRRKSRKAHFAAPSSIRRKIMSAPLSKELREQYKVRSLPIRKDDEVVVSRGSQKGKEGKVTQVYRLKYIVRVDKISKTKASGATQHINLSTSNLVLTKIRLDKDRLALIKRKGGNAE